MKIRSVRALLLSYPFPEPVVLAYHGGLRTIVKRDAMLIRVEADNGLIGYAPGPGSESARNLIEGCVAPFLQDRLLSDPDALRVRFFEGPGKDPDTRKIYCAVEVALYDLLGRELGVPVSELIGGRVRDSIRLYGSAGMYQSPEGYAKEAAGVASLGFTAYKMRPAAGPDEDVRAVELMRESVGYGVDLMVDAHSWWRMGDRGYSAETVGQVARELGSLGVTWLEEPLPPADHPAYARLKDTGYVQLAAGEHEPSEDGFQDLILSNCVDFVQMDTVCQGGYVSCRRVLADVARAGLRFAFHCWGTDLEVIAAAHLGICWPEQVAEWLECPVYTTDRLTTMYPFPPAQEILRQPLLLEDGELLVPDTPGLGVEVDESIVDRYPWIPGPWSFYRIDSPPQTFAVVGDHSVAWAEGKQA